MENRQTQTTFRQSNFNPLNFVESKEDAEAQARLEALMNFKILNEIENQNFRNEDERRAFEMMKSPLSTETATAYFGAMLGLFPPFALFSRFVFEKFRYATASDDLWIIPLLLFVNFVCLLVGYFSGKFIGRLVKDLEKRSWSAMILATPFLGIFWGIMAGAAGGLFLFVIGAIFGAFLGGAVGAVALPVFAILHRTFKIGDSIEEKHFFPISLGIAGTITAFILGLNF